MRQKNKSRKNTLLLLRDFFCFREFFNIPERGDRGSEVEGFGKNNKNSRMLGFLVCQFPPTDHRPKGGNLLPRQTKKDLMPKTSISGEDCNRITILSIITVQPFVYYHLKTVFSFSWFTFPSMQYIIGCC